MKYSAAVLLFAAAALAQNDGTVTSAPASKPVATGLTSAVSCAMACDAGDVTCQAACLGNARPNASQAIETTECAAKCDQGDGSPAATERYSKCVDGCINSLFPSSQTAFVGGAGAGAPAPSPGASSGANSAGTARPTGTNAAPSGTASGTGAGSEATGSSASGSSARPSPTGAADKPTAQIFGAGLAGLLAIFAL